MPTVKTIKNPNLTLCPYGLCKEGEEDHCLCPTCCNQGGMCCDCIRCKESWDIRRGMDMNYPKGNHVIIECEECNIEFNKEYRE